MWLICGVFLFHLVSAQHYRIPDVKLQAFSRGGFRVSIPDSPGIQLFAFHGNLNRPLEDTKSGEWSRDIVKSRNGRWTFEEPDFQLKLGDVIYYWIFVQVDGQGYTERNQRWVVSSYDVTNDDVIAYRTPSGSYEIPDAKLEVLHPKGIRVSIPDEPGIQLFAFHGNVNTPLAHDLEAGTMSRDIVRPRNGRWIYQNDNVRLRNGDVVYYWLYVIVDGIGHQKLNQKWVVKDNPLDIETGVTYRERTESYEVPEAKLEVLQPKGIRVSIPDEPGIQLFAFHGNVNTPLTHDLEAGTMSRDIVRPKNGRWVYQNDNVRLRNGDILYYWLYTIVNGIGHQRLNQKWVVTGVADSDTPEDVSVPVVPPAKEVPSAEDFFELNFKLPEGMELVVVVKDGKLLLKKPLPSQLAFENANSVKLGSCKATNICVPSVGILQRK